MKDRLELSLHEAIKFVLDAFELKMAGILFNLFYIVDKPGAGKTMMFTEETKKRGLGFLSYSPALERLEKFGGIPDVYWKGEDKSAPANLRTVWSAPAMIDEINDVAEKHPEGVVVLLDDWHLCPEDIQQIGFELFTYYKLNNSPVAPNVMFVLAGNESSAAGARVQLSAIRNRCTMIYTHPDPEYWVQRYAIPTGIHPLGVSFFQNPDNIRFFQEEESTSEQFGSPRSWTSALRLIRYAEVNGVSKNMVYAIVQGSVGSAAAQKFMSHYDVYSKIRVEDWFTAGKKVEIPDKPVDRFCLAAAMNEEFYRRVCKWMGDKKKEDDPRKFYVKFLEMVVNNGHKEIAAITLTNFRNYGTGEGQVSGVSIFKQMMQDKLITADLVAKIIKEFEVLG